MGTDPVFIAMEFYRFSKVDWENTAVCDGFPLYDFRTGEVYGLEEEYIRAAKKIKGDDVASSWIVLPAVPLYIHNGVHRTLLEAVTHN